jgi:hypothetical protein
MARRSNAEIEATERLHSETRDIARGIDERVNGERLDGPTISASAIWGVKARFQHELATTLVVSFTTKDAVVAERVALAVRAALEAK